MKKYTNVDAWADFLKQRQAEIVEVDERQGGRARKKNEQTFIQNGKQLDLSYNDSSS